MKMKLLTLVMMLFTAGLFAQDNILDAVAKGDMKAVKKFIEVIEVEVNAEIEYNYSTCTPLQMAIMTNRFEVAKYLVEKGAKDDNSMYYQYLSISEQTSLWFNKDYFFNNYNFDNISFAKNVIKKLYHNPSKLKGFIQFLLDEKYYTMMYDDIIDHRLSRALIIDAAIYNESLGKNKINIKAPEVSAALDDLAGIKAFLKTGETLNYSAISYFFPDKIADFYISIGEITKEGVVDLLKKDLDNYAYYIENEKELAFIDKYMGLANFTLKYETIIPAATKELIYKKYPKVKDEVDAKLKAEADTKAKAEEEEKAKLKAEADARAKINEEAKLRVEAEAKERLNAEVDKQYKFNLNDKTDSINFKFFLITDQRYELYILDSNNSKYNSLFQVEGDVGKAVWFMVGEDPDFNYHYDIPFKLYVKKDNDSGLGLIPGKKGPVANLKAYDKPAYIKIVPYKNDPENYGTYYLILKKK